MAWKSEKEAKQVTLSGGWRLTTEEVPDTDRIVQVIIKNIRTGSGVGFVEGDNGNNKTLNYSRYSPISGWTQGNYCDVLAWCDVERSALEFIKVEDNERRN